MSAPIASTRWLRIASGLVLLFTFAGTAALGVLAFTKLPELNTVPEKLNLFALPLLSLAAGIGLSAIVHALAHTPASTPTIVAAPPVAPSPSVALEQLVEAMQAATRLAEPPPPTVPLGTVLDAIEPLPLHPAVEAYLEKSLRLLEEIREVSMLDESERSNRRQMSIRQRKTSRLDEAADLMTAKDFAAADALLHLLESLYPGDDEVLRKRNELDDLKLAETQADWQNTESAVLDLTVANRHAEAIPLLEAYIDRNPGRDDGPALLAQVRADAERILEERAQLLFDLVKNEVDRRQWRQALGHVQQLLAELPDHSVAQRVRPQVPTIQKNAEIEERREQEAHIHELVKNTQYAEAIEASEQLIQLFPSSPQARTLGAALPKLRKLNAEQQTPVAAASPFAD